MAGRRSSPPNRPDAHARAAEERAEQKAKALEVVGMTWGTVRLAAEAAGVTRTTLWQWRQEDEAFAVAWHDARQERKDRLYEEAGKRATQGGSDALLALLLKAADPEAFRERRSVEHSGQIDAGYVREIRAAAEANPEAFEAFSRALAEVASK